MYGRRRRRVSVKRFWLVAAIGVLAALMAALGGSTAYGGSSSASAAAPIKLGALTPLTGPFSPWGLQVRAGMALAVNEINRSGGVKGRGQGRMINLVVADDQSDEHERGDRRLQAADAAGGRRLGRWHHRQPHRPRDLSARRGGEGAALPREGGEQRDPDPVEPLHVPHLSAVRSHGGRFGRAACATARTARAWA